jgi:hypothetical protein
MSKFYIPTNGVAGWQSLLADPVKHWKTGYSAKALACCWEEAQGFPVEVINLFEGTALEGIKFLLGIPEHKVPLRGGSTQSQNDAFILAKAGNELVSITVEGKVAEPFGPTLGEWLQDASAGKSVRLDYLKKRLGLRGNVSPDIRYQLLHRTASAVIEAKRFNASKAVMIVHSFSQETLWFDDYSAFLALYGKSASVGDLVCVCTIDGIDLFLGWAKGDAKYLEA